jgi:hypothetical protein
MVKDCVMCGKNTKRLIGRWFQYDNGEQFLEYVCTKCAEFHTRLLNK